MSEKRTVNVELYAGNELVGSKTLSANNLREVQELASLFNSIMYARASVHESTISNNILLQVYMPAGRR